MEKIKFYIKRENVDSDYIDIESYFKGMKYKSCTGLNNKGKIKNIYIETYSDSDSVNICIPEPDEITREATTITFEFVFIGDDRLSLYELFYNYIKGYKIFYYDTKRQKQTYMVMQEAPTKVEDVNKGSNPYIIYQFQFYNLWGEAKPFFNQLYEKIY